MFNPELLKLDITKDSFRVYYNSKELKLLGKSNRYCFQLDNDSVIKFDNPFHNQFYSNQCKLEIYTWELLNKDYPQLIKFFAKIFYSGEYQKDKFYIVSEKCHCFDFEENTEYLRYNHFTVKPFDLSTPKYDGYQLGERDNGEVIIYDYAFNNFSMSVIPTELL